MKGIIFNLDRLCVTRPDRLRVLYNADVGPLTVRKGCTIINRAILGWAAPVEGSGLVQQDLPNPARSGRKQRYGGSPGRCGITWSLHRSGPPARLPEYDNA